MRTRPIRILSTRIGKKCRDSAVAEIIGVVLIFAIVITLFTTFILWYVPATGTMNEQHYEVQNQNAFYSMADGLSDTGVSQGKSVSYSFSLGVQGVPPFSPSNPSSISFSTAYDNFSASMSYGVTVTYTPSSGTLHYYNLTESYNATGVFKSNVDTQFTTPTYFDLQDGFLIQTQGNSNPPLGIGPLPISLNNTTAGGITLGSSLLNFSGPSSTVSSVGSSMVSLYYNKVNSTSFTVGKPALVNGTSATINSITVNSFKYQLNGKYSSQWDYSFFHSYNSSSASFNSISGIGSWNFTSLPFLAKVSGDTLDITSTSAVSVSSVDFSYMQLNVNSI